MSPIRILIVEDEKLVADDLQETLELMGYEVLGVAVSGEEAILDLETISVDLVLMDIRLAGAMDGIEASQTIQAQYRIPVVYLTANADRPTLDRVKASQPFGYILKPFNERALTTTIEIALARHQAETLVYEELRTAQINKQSVEAQLQQKSAYFHLVAHELRNPLTAIKFAVEVLDNCDLEMSEDRRQRYLQRIHAATKNLNDLLEDVLLLERSNANELDVCPTSINLNEFCEMLLDAFRLTTDGTHEFRFTSSGEPQMLLLDERLLWHLCSNLISNAVKYSPQGGIVALILNWSGDRVEVKVQDSGIGIPPETLAKLFEPFRRGRNVGSIPGTGLGLAIASRCAVIQGGQITAESELGQGTTFTVTFPLGSAE